MEIFTTQEERLLNSIDIDRSVISDNLQDYVKLVEVTTNYTTKIDDVIDCIIDNTDVHPHIRIGVEHARKSASGGFFSSIDNHTFVYVPKQFLEDNFEKHSKDIGAPRIAYRGVNFNKKLPDSWKSLVNNMKQKTHKNNMDGF